MSYETEQERMISVISRREAIRRVSAMLGGVALIGGSTLVAACERNPRKVEDAVAAGFTEDDVAFLDEVADTILPDTEKSPGAKAAKVGPFIAVMVADTYEPDDQQVFRAGMKTLDEACMTANNVSFMKATPQQRLALLEQVDREAKEYQDARDREDEAKTTDVKEAETNQADTSRTDTKQESPNHYFRMMKELTLLGYFTSEIGMTKAQRYVESPGRFDPCVPYAAGETSWAPHA
jgi:hypothetical protein